MFQALSSTSRALRFTGIIGWTKKLISKHHLGKSYFIRKIGKENLTEPGLEPKTTGTLYTIRC